MQVGPPSPSLDGHTWGAVPVISEIPILRGAMDEEPVRGRVDCIKPDVPRDGRRYSYELRSVGGSSGQSDVCT